MTAFRVFSGWDSRQAEAAEVFAYSVHANASIEVDVRFLRLGKPDEWLGIRSSEGVVIFDLEAIWPHDRAVIIDGFKRQGTTQFSYTRFLVPWLCGFQGRALFADGCDQLCLGDVAELADFDLHGKALAVVKHPDPRQARPRVWTSLMLMDCSRLTMWTPERVQREPDDVLMRLRHLSDEHIGELPGGWNWLMADGIDADQKHPAMKLAHWSYLADPNGNSWIDRSGSALWAEWREWWRTAMTASYDTQYYNELAEDWITLARSVRREDALSYTQWLHDNRCQPDGPSERVLRVVSPSGVEIKRFENEAP